MTYENGGTGYVIQANQQAETLNGYGPSVATDNVPDGVTYSYKYSARAVLDEYKNYDIRLASSCRTMVMAQAMVRMASI